MTNKEVISKIKNGLTDYEIERLVMGGFDEDDEANIEFVDEEEEEEDRWSIDIRTIVKIDDKYFSITWSRGLTEYQPNDFTQQPKEVVPRIITETITSTVYVKKAENGEEKT